MKRGLLIFGILCFLAADLSLLKSFFNEMSRVFFTGDDLPDGIAAADGDAKRKEEENATVLCKDDGSNHTSHSPEGSTVAFGGCESWEQASLPVWATRDNADQHSTDVPSYKQSERVRFYIDIIGCDDRESPVVDMVVGNRILYAQQHGYRFFFFGGGTKLLQDIHPKYGKLEAILRTFHPSLDGKQWIVWMDADTLIANTSIPFKSIIERFAHTETDFIVARDLHNGYPMNTGVFLIRNTKWSFDYVTSVMNIGIETETTKSPQAMRDQPIMVEQLRKQGLLEKTGYYDLKHPIAINSRISVIPTRMMNSFCRTSPGYITFDQRFRETGAWHPGDFIVHFTGPIRDLDREHDIGMFIKWAATPGHNFPNPCLNYDQTVGEKQQPGKQSYNQNVRGKQQPMKQNNLGTCATQDAPDPSQLQAEMARAEELRKQLESSGQCIKGKHCVMPCGDDSTFSVPMPPPGTQLGMFQVSAIWCAIKMESKRLGRAANLLVYGLGNDSPFWSNSTEGRVVFIEDNKSWFDNIKAKHPGLEQYIVKYHTVVERDIQRVGSPSFEKEMDHILDSSPEIIASGVANETWDVVLVDAPAGCGLKDVGRFAPIYTSRRMVTEQGHGIIFVDDYQRSPEKLTADVVLDGGLTGKCNGTLCGDKVAVWDRVNPLTGKFIEKNALFSFGHSSTENFKSTMEGLPGGYI